MLRSLGVAQLQLTRCFVYETVRVAACQAESHASAAAHGPADGVHVRGYFQWNRHWPGLRCGADLPAGDEGLIDHDLSHSDSVSNAEIAHF